MNPEELENFTLVCPFIAFGLILPGMRADIDKW
jgi:hypothetical protein